MRDRDRDRDGDRDRDRDFDRRDRDRWDNDGRWYSDRFGRRGRYFWDGDRWFLAFGPRYGYWDGIGWGYGPWGYPGYGYGGYGLGYGPGYYNGYADSRFYSQPRYAQTGSGPALGIFMDERDGMVFVRSVVQGSPAQEAGLQAGDRILAINDMEIRSASQVSDIVARHNAGDELAIEVEADGREIRAAAVLEDRQRVF